MESTIFILPLFFAIPLLKTPKMGWMCVLLFFPDGIAPRYLMDAADAFWRYLNNLVENVDGSPDRLCFEAVNSYFCECFVKRGSTGKFRKNSQKREQLQLRKSVQLVQCDAMPLKRSACGHH